MSLPAPSGKTDLSAESAKKRQRDESISGESSNSNQPPTATAVRSQAARPDVTQIDLADSSHPDKPSSPRPATPAAPNNGSQLLAQTLLLGPQSPIALDLTNCMLGEFRVLRRLGSGGMAQVYLAEQTSLKRNVAIKVMRPEMGNDNTFRQRFEHEAKAAAGLNHPNIVQVFAVGETDGLRYIAQEYVLGINLKQYIHKKKPPSAQVVIHLMKQVCGALQAAHDAGIVHRDIKPENIMVTRKMIAKVTDFGLAQLTQGGERVNLTQMGMTMGTPLYMSPEQIQAGKVDHRADLYSLGVAFYHLLTGQPPFNGENAFALAYKHVNDLPPPLRELRSDLPPKLIELIHRLMAKNPDDRYADAKSVIAELKHIEKSPDTPADLADDDERAALYRRLRIPRHKLIAYAITCLLVYFIAVRLGRDSRRPHPLDEPPKPPPATTTE